ncbi:MAG: hypothetical protein J6Q51_02505 [Clostridia bacterium]|nr:hypothetical protein [Clostridia bacterium]
MKRFMTMVAFIGLFLVALALLLAKLLGVFGVSASAVSAIRTVGECIAYLVTIVYAYNFVRTKRSAWWWVAYCVSVVVVVLLIILR